MNKQERQEYMKQWREIHKQEEKESQKLYRETHKEEIKERLSRWRKTHKEHLKKYKLDHKEHIKEQNKKYRLSHKKEIKKYSDEYCLTHKKEINIRGKEYYQKNRIRELERCKKYRDTHKEQKKKYFKIKRKIDINYKITGNLRNRIYLAIKRNIKSACTLDLLGCSIEQLKLHLEKQFVKGMSWSNYGKWHIDHIKPCASFDLSKPEEQKLCFHYSNLQPLWAKENISKKDKVI